MKLRILFLFLLVNSVLDAQELIQTEYEKGYMKDGEKYSVWQYFNPNKEVELAINHTTGKIMYVIPDTSKYVIFKNGKWIQSKLDIHPVPVTGYHNFYTAIKDMVKYPEKDFKNGLEGIVAVTFDVDTIGFTTNYAIVKSVGGTCDSSVIASLKKIDQKWAPAKAGTETFLSKFALSFEFRLFQDQSPWVREGFKIDNKKARLLEEFVVKISSASNDGLSSEDKLDRDDEKIFTFVEQSAEPVGGLEAFYKWVDKTLRYPVAARKNDLEGKVFVKFIIEPTGEITNAEVVKGFYPECDQEAIRVISIAPKWKPGRQSGRTVRQAYTLPIAFRLRK